MQEENHLLRAARSAAASGQAENPAKEGSAKKTKRKGKKPAAAAATTAAAAVPAESSTVIAHVLFGRAFAPEGVFGKDCIGISASQDSCDKYLFSGIRLHPSLAVLIDGPQYACMNSLTDLLASGFCRCLPHQSHQPCSSSPPATTPMKMLLLMVWLLAWHRSPQWQGCPPWVSWKTGFRRLT